MDILLQEHQPGKIMGVKTCPTCLCTFNRETGTYCTRRCSALGASNFWKGRTLSPEHREKISKAKTVYFDRPRKVKLTSAQLRVARKAFGQRRTGPLNPNWKGGRRSETQMFRDVAEYKEWRMSVFRRDNFTCTKCLVRGGVLNADHIKPFALYPDLRFELSNGRTLCVPCHRLTDTFGGRTKKI